MPDGPVTLSRVAREAGVSLATASRAINGSATRTVRPELRERVLAAAEALGYVPDPSAQAMARGRTAALGLVVHDIADPYFSAIASGVSRAAEAEGLIVTLSSTEQHPERELGFVDLVRRQRGRAVILAGSRVVSDDAGAGPATSALTGGNLQETLTAFQESGGGVATIGQAIGTLPVVEIDNAGGAAALARELHGLGYRRFGILSGPPALRTASDRTAGFRDMIRSLGGEVRDDDVVAGEFTRDGGYAAMERLAAGAHGDLPDLVFAVNDVMAVGAMAAVRHAGMSVPDDVAVAGFDDIPTLRDVTPELTTVHIALERIGEAATRLALGIPTSLDRASGDGASDGLEATSSRSITVHGEIRLRASTPPAP
ncbi:LacI family DNA-binding transcriptional regulator [Myceligenerans crystallogenes]|uniref:LacI family DNA-binding transcriptional regulator n=1 Tax=Myceligenerans crystallogenes TaxID=316335 RepID=A0ABN2N362_9MICO